MKLVIPEGLPPADLAHALVEPFAKRFPKTVHLLNARQAEPSTWPVHQHGCTPSEALLLESLGYQARPAQPIGAGLGPLHAGIDHDPNPVWIAQFSSTAIRQEGATLVPYALLNLSDEHAQSLEQAASDYFADNHDGIEITPLKKGLWRVHADIAPDTPTISPQALLARDLGDFWPTAPGLRAWRKRVNEIQMAWHEHPANLERQSQGQPPINSVWLYGGGSAFEPSADPAIRWIDHLQDSALRGDWGQWLENWAPVESVLLAADPQHPIILCNDQRIVTLSNSPGRWWRQLLTKSGKQDWRNWWLSNQN